MGSWGSPDRPESGVGASNLGLSKSGPSGLANASSNPEPVSSTREWAEACEWNTEGSQLVHAGDFEPGMDLLSRSARYGLPWALSSYTWWCLLGEDFSRGLREFDASREACELMVARLQEEENLAAVARLQWANAQSNVALLKVASGGSLEAARETWNAGADTGHAESLFYPALVAEKLGQPLEADALVQGLPLSTWFEMKQTLQEGIERGGWFGQWCNEGIRVLERNQLPIALPHPSDIDVDKVLALPRVHDETMHEGFWDVITAAIQGSSDAESALRAFAEGGDPTAWAARMELGTLLSDPTLRPASCAEEGMDLLATCLQAPYRDVIATTAWNLALTPTIQAQADLADGFMDLAVTLGDGTAMRSIADRLLEQGDESSAVGLFERASEELPFGDVNRALSRARLAALNAEHLQEPFSTWFSSHQGALSLDTWSHFASITVLNGDFNVDTARAAIATQYFEECPSQCYFDSTPRDCWDCGRTQTSFLQAASGNGDGGYNILNILGPCGSAELDHVGVFIPFLEVDRANMAAVARGSQFADIIVAGAPLVLGTLQCPGELFVFDAAKNFDDSDVSLRIEVPHDEYVVVCWLRPDMDLVAQLSNRELVRRGLAARETDPLTCIALAAVRGPLAQALLDTAQGINDIERGRLLTELWDNESRLVHALMADIRPQILARMVESDSDDEPTTSYLLQFAEREGDGEAARTEVRSSGRVGSHETLDLLAQRGFLEPNLPWWTPEMARDPRDIWTPVLEARTEHHTPLANVEGQSEWARRSLARRADLSPTVIEVLARDPDNRVRKNVAGNISTPERVLAVLAQDPDPAVRSSVALNPATPVETLAVLAQDARAPIGGLAGNPNTPSSVLPLLLENAPTTTVRTTIAGRRDLPPDLASRLSIDVNSVKSSLASNESCPRNVLANLAKDASDMVRSGVAANPSTPDATLLELALDPVEFVREAVMANPTASETTRAQASLIGTPPPTRPHHDETVRPTAGVFPPATTAGLSSGPREHEATGGMNFCTNCGSRRSPGDKFCGSCGQVL